MEDEFLRNAKPPVRPAFAEALYQELQRMPRRDNLLQRLRARPLALAIAILLVGVTGVAAAQAIQYFWERRGEFWVHEGDPICQGIHYSGYEHSNLSSAPAPVPVTEALAMLEYPVRLPTWAPDGFELVETMRPPPTPHSEVFLYWADAARNRIAVAAFQTEYAPEAIGPQGSLELLTINGREALLIRGGCAFPNPEELAGLADGAPFRTEWVDTMARLSVRDDGVLYWLFVTGPYATAEDLIRMAESIP